MEYLAFLYEQRGLDWSFALRFHGCTRYQHYLASKRARQHNLASTLGEHDMVKKFDMVISRPKRYQDARQAY